ncbi:MAG: DTW domain-containing protein [Cephaloticoccus sp.]|nr:DTW domain-containing protein [Cephaloticoccus sp.]MCF7760753.1 DTW domain-containing protein [Cephaloticoccus sp.]
MSRLTCYRCFRPQSMCLCDALTAMVTRTRFVLLMHPKEFKREKANTGRLTQLCLANSEILVGTDFDDHEAVQARLANPAFLSVLLYPGNTALNLSLDDPIPAAYCRKPLQVFLLDATWSAARKMLRLSPSLQRLPRIMFTPTAPSRYLIKQQPQEGCLSTLETVHELLMVLQRTGLDDYPLPDQLLMVFARMQQFQMECAADPNLGGYRRQAYTAPAERTPAQGQSRKRRRYIKTD